MLIKILKNISLALVLASLSLACHKSNTDEDRQRAISFFIMEMADDFDSYLPTNFQKIDVDFLESQIAIYEQFVIVQDTTQKRLQLIDCFNLKLPDQQAFFRKANYHLDDVDELLIFNAQLDLILESSNHSLDKDVLLSEKVALQRLNKYLGLYNLSIYALDLSGKENTYYYHKFELGGELKEAIFEIDHQTENILSFKEIG